VNEGTEGPPIWDVVENHIKAKGTVSIEPNQSVQVVGA
jgi:sulfur-oxidizing protein SoxB